MKKFVITGGNFMNTGAAAMSYVTISELRKRYPDCEINMAIDYGDGRAYPNLKSGIVYILGDSMKLLSHRIRGDRFIKAVIKKIIRREDIFKQVGNFKRIIRECDAVFDISGYIISSQWDVGGNLDKLGQMEFILNCGKPLYIMPQSFGPFDYGDKTEVVVETIKRTLSKCVVVYTRETDGYYLLRNDLGLKNVKYSYDMVLQNQGIEWDSVFESKEDETVPRITSSNNVAIIPNMRLLDCGNDELLLGLYSRIIEELIKLKKNIFLISHSAEDKELCQRIKKTNPHDSVHILGEKMDSRAFERVIQKMDYAVASRFHSIVHAYRNDVPCIILGWAVKYRELARLFSQDKYFFDIQLLSEEYSPDRSLKIMDKSFPEEKQIIAKKLFEIQKDNCFDSLDF